MPKQTNDSKNPNPCGSAFWLLEFTAMKHIRNPQLTETYINKITPSLDQMR